ncbi:DNA cytosine methyltransferase [Burkholderia sp. LMU1-1-1.1]
MSKQRALDTVLIHSTICTSELMGMALGFSGNDARHRAVVEWNTHACNTIRHTKQQEVAPIHRPDVTEVDVKHFKYNAFDGIDLITGGPPCQPFPWAAITVASWTSATCFRRQCAPCGRPVRARASSRTCRASRAPPSQTTSTILLQLEFPSLTVKPKEQRATTLPTCASGRTSRAPSASTGSRSSG